MRCMHEASLYKKNCFITLTYADEHLPRGGSLDYEAPVLFMKRLRKKFGADIRSYGCAEYGERYQRPHYHLCLFNHDFEDKKVLKKNGENTLYRSQTLEELWRFGNSSIGALTFESAAYVARYVTKKITGARAEEHYQRVDEIGQIHSVLPEKAICVSRRPGIGREWFEKYGEFVKTHDMVIMRGKRMRPAKYYDRIFHLDDEKSFNKISFARKQNGKKIAQQLDAEDARNRLKPYRLSVMETCKELQAKQLKRGLENE